MKPGLSRSHALRSHAPRVHALRSHAARRLAAALALSLLAACNGRLSPSTTVTGVRVLAVGADRPEVRPGESTAVRALIADPHGGGRPLGAVWLGCPPAELGKSPCDDLAALLDLASFAQQPGVTGLASNPPVYSAPPGVLDGLTAARREFGGLDGQVVLGASALASGGAPAGADESTARIKVSESRNPNRNPGFTAVTIDGREAPEDQVVEIAADSTPALRLEVDRDQSEAVPILDLLGPAPCTPLAGCTDPKLCPSADCRRSQMCRVDQGRCEKHEQLRVDWYSTAGTFSRAPPGQGPGGAPLPDEEGDQRIPRNVQILFVAPGLVRGRDPVPPGGLVTLWVVLRDDRYGVSWTSRTLRVR